MKDPDRTKLHEMLSFKTYMQQISTGYLFKAFMEEN